MIPVEDVRPTVARRYRRQAAIPLAADDVLRVESGVVALWASDEDGAEGLLGLFGPGQLLCGHPVDGCQLRLESHSDATVRIAGWQEALQWPDLADRLRDRLRGAEAWAAVQTRPSADRRLLGTLAHLGEQFGSLREGGLLIDVSVTHSLLAAAVGLTRTTVTRRIRALRAGRTIAAVRTSKGERYVLPGAVRRSHAAR